MNSFKDLAKSEYYETLKQEFEVELTMLMTPSNIPLDDFTNTKAHILLARFIEKKLAKLEKLRNDNKVIETSIKLTDKERKSLSSFE